MLFNLSLCRIPNKSKKNKKRKKEKKWKTQIFQIDLSIYNHFHFLGSQAEEIKTGKRNTKTQKRKQNDSGEPMK